MSKSANLEIQMQGLPPLIDRELLFGDPEISGGQLSPDGRYIALLKPWKETRNIWVKRTDEPFSSVRLVSNATARGVTGFLWIRDSNFIAYTKLNGGDETSNACVVDPARVQRRAATPRHRAISPIPAARVPCYSARQNPIQM